ncbi:MAG: hypothetical protein AAFO85_15095 [Cyanobacteria bacterium J06598_4]
MKQERRKMRAWSEANQYVSNGDWMALAKHFEKHGEQVIGSDMQPIEFESTEEHAEYLKENFRASAKANKLKI